ncbi:MAG: hypothetical protein H7Y60_16215 [Rhodospirillaceae bacterium]|nr:hypothetical protein [Rhodospirillales bacterium]
MVDSVSQTSVGTSASLAETLAKRDSATTSAKSSASAQRSINDVVDLSKSAQAAAELRSSNLTGKQLTDKLAQSLDQGKSIGQSFAAQMKAGRSATSSAGTEDKFTDALFSAVKDIMTSGKPGNVLTSIVNKLYKK